MVGADISDLKVIGLPDIFDDEWTRTVYSVDASHCNLKPAAVHFPSDEHDVQRICKYAYTHEIPITCRGAGTGLLGQALSDGIVLDFTKKMNRILEFGNDYVTVQPGIVKAVLDKELAKKGKFIPPDPVSSNYCTIGGMLSNNSSGPHGLGYGSMINYVQKVDLVYSNGMPGYADAKHHDERIGKMLKFITSLNIDMKSHYPNVSKNSSGYRLDAIFGNGNLSPQNVFVASEGTLAIVTSSKISIMDIPDKKALVILGLENILEAAKQVPYILEFGPVALELLERGALLEGWKHGEFIGDNSRIMFVEFYGNDNSVYDKVRNFEASIRGKTKILETAYDRESVNRAWNERKNSLNAAIKSGVGSRRPAGIIEDTVVHPKVLYDHLIFLMGILAKHQLDYVIYGHAGNGNLHLRPLIDINSKESLSLLNSIADNVFKHVFRLHGSTSGEHGDGLIRTKYIPLMYGNVMYDIFKKIKRIFDNKNIMNPGKKIL